MGLMRFAIVPPDRITPQAAEKAYLSGLDRVAWAVSSSLEQGQLVLRRSISESGSLNVPWPVPGAAHGWLTLATGTLPERSEPYHLSLELARGTVNQLRHQLADWQTIGLAVPEKITAMLARAVGMLGRAAAGETEPARVAEWAERAIQLAVDAGTLLGATYADQAIAVRRRGDRRLPSLFGANLGMSHPATLPVETLLPASNAAIVPLYWREIEASEGTFHWEASDRQIEWCQRQGLKVVAGPLLQLSSAGLPDWLSLWDGEFDDIFAFLSDFVAAAVKRYRGKVDYWLCAGRLNSAQMLSLSDEEKLRLAAQSVEVARSLDPGVPILVSFDQPWAEYLSRRASDFPPLHFADAMIRSGLGLSGIVLEVNLGYEPGGTLPRTALEWSRHLDFWSSLGVPLFLTLTVPSDSGRDPKADPNVAPVLNRWSARAQQAWAGRFLPLILAKPYMFGVLWNQLSDATAHEFPHGGLLDAQGRPKPIVETLTAIRQAHLV